MVTTRISMFSAAIVFIAGFLSLTLENLGMQVVFLFQAQSANAVSVGLAFFLAGLTVGSWLVYLFNQKWVEEREKVIAWSFLGLALLSGPFLGSFETISFYLREFFRSIPVTERYVHESLFVSVSALYLFLPAILIGVFFPLGTDVALRQTQPQTLSVGKMNAIDLIGAVLGSLLTGFALVPIAGLAQSFWIISWICGGLGFALAIKQGLRLRIASIIVVLGLFSSLIFSRPLEVPLHQQVKVLFQKPSPFGTVTVTESPTDSGVLKGLYINHRGMCTSLAADGERDMAKLTLNGESPSSATTLNIGLGCGILSSEMVRAWPKANLDIVEINKTVAGAAGTYFAKENQRVLEQPNVRLHIMDGFKFLRENSGMYDRILVDIEEPTIIHSSALFTKDGFELVKSRLKSNGVFALWSFEQKETAKIILNTLRSIFKSAHVVPVNGNLVFLATDGDFVPPYWGDQKKAAEIESVPLDLIATVRQNPYPRYYKVDEIFQFQGRFKEEFEIK